jgi:hypothetical protein
MVVFRDVCFEKALRMFDVHVTIALHTQPEKTISSIDLENPPASMLTTSGRKVRLVGNTGEGDCPYVISVEDGKYPILLYSNRNGSVTVSTSKLDVTLFVLCAAPVTKTGWIHIYPNMICSGTVHHTRQEAEKSASNGCIAILEITWEE